MKEGEHSKFSHRYMIQRIQNNRFNVIKYAQHNTFSTHSNIEVDLTDFLKHELEEPHPDTSLAISKIVRHISHLVSDAHNEILMCHITLQEVKKVVMDMVTNKSPSLIDLLHTSCIVIGT